MSKHQPAPPSGTAADPAIRGLRLALVEDDADVRKALSRLLGAVGCSVTSFPSAEAYLAREEGDGPDCLVLDIGLGGMSGFELREELLRTEACVPIVFITARDDEATRQALLQLGSVPCLRKPFTDRSLLSAIALATRAS